MGLFYHSQHEPVFVFKHGHNGHRNNVQLDQFGRNRTNAWLYPGSFLRALRRRGQCADASGRPQLAEIATIHADEVDRLISAQCREVPRSLAETGSECRFPSRPRLSVIGDD
jgi:hypothetical protein